MSESDYYNDYYEKLHLIERKLTLEEENRIKNTIDLIPSKIKSLLEVGCGDGRILNQLIGKYENICGLDISYNALNYVQAETVQGSLEKLPFPDNSFDVVICCEVLEHLPYSIYEKSLKEIERVSKKYILISVPNDENLNIGMIKCPQCGCFSHIWRHLRSFNTKKLESLFRNFKIHKTKILFTDQFMFSNLVFKLKTLLNIKNQEFSMTSLCPQCSYSPEYDGKNEIDLNKKKSLKTELLKEVLPTKKAGGWIIVLYKHSGS